MTGGQAEGARRGRRAGNPQTRDVIRHQALDQFAQHGFGGASIRSIAAAAGVDPSLVIHFYGSKQALFTATLDLLGDIPEQLRAVFAGGREGLGRRLADVYLSLWEDPVTGAQMQALFRSVTTNQDAAAIVRRVLGTRVLPAAAGHSEHLADRVPLVMTQLLGIAMARFVLDVEPIKALSRQELVDRITAAVEATLGA